MPALEQAGVPTRRWYYPPLPEHPAYAACATLGDLAATRRLAAGLLGLPFHGGLTDTQADDVMAALDSLLR